MKGLFRAFDREGVDYLLMGGQAAILYGAAHFTQDLDLWIRPSPRNVRAFLRALSRVAARVHKLTPPLSPRWVARGHGFHFLIPQSGRSDAYLDALGRPPRVGGFSVSARRARRMTTPWGELPVVAIEDLVELKKTNRPGDYEVISRLVRIRLGELGSPNARRLSWAIRNTFRVEDLLAIAGVYKISGLAGEPPIRRLCAALCQGGHPAGNTMAAAGKALDRKMTRLLERGREYWLPRIRELRSLRFEGGLIPEGTPVRNLLR